MTPPQLPQELIEHILSFLLPLETIRLHTLSRGMQNLLKSHPFAKRCLARQLNPPLPVKNTNPTTMDRSWFILPHPFQELYAQLCYAETREIRWRGKGLCGRVPAAIGFCTGLRYLSLAGNNGLGGACVPRELGRLKGFEVLYLGNCGFVGGIPREVGELVRLRELSLRGNALTGVVPRELGQLKECRVLYLDCNMLRGTVPKELGMLKKLDTLYLRGNLLEEVLEEGFDEGGVVFGLLRKEGFMINRDIEE
ncbi:L domain-like protein [Rhizoclosmatium globosum]|uniref:L domain-like protein n=1 Tax=Rhizoclosmatium globosum TaxID=329046 RepID=A0A1Y2CNX0_9FUNG|nr:L domain-like protein [Rhizoclosmatium globosum]|eukprot:ORY48544.1 L domain-like protein [Rhizoclosmatium globosum]